MNNKYAIRLNGVMMLFLIRHVIDEYEGEYVPIAETEHFTTLQEAGVKFVKKIYYTKRGKTFAPKTFLAPRARKDEKGNLILSKDGEPDLYNAWITEDYTKTKEYKEFIKEHAVDIVETEENTKWRGELGAEISYWHKHTDMFAEIESLEQILTIFEDIAIENRFGNHEWSKYYDEDKREWNPFWNMDIHV